MTEWVDFTIYKPHEPDIYMIRVASDIYSAYPCYNVRTANFNGNYFYDEHTCKCIRGITHWSEVDSGDDYYEDWEKTYVPVIGDALTV